MNWASGPEADYQKKDGHWKGDLSVEKIPFRNSMIVEEVPFRPMASILAVLEHLYSEIALHSSSHASDFTAHEQYFPLGPRILRHSGIWGAADEAVLKNVHKKKKIPLQFFFKNNGDKPAFQKGRLSTTFSSKFKDSTFEDEDFWSSVNNCKETNCRWKRMPLKPFSNLFRPQTCTIALRDSSMRWTSNSLQFYVRKCFQFRS